jgi:hypothetical protein
MEMKINKRPSFKVSLKEGCVYVAESIEKVLRDRVARRISYTLLGGYNISTIGVLSKDRY